MFDISATFETISTLFLRLSAAWKPCQSVTSSMQRRFPVQHTRLSFVQAGQTHSISDGGPKVCLIRQLFLRIQISSAAASAPADSGSVLQASQSAAQDGLGQVASDTLQQMFPPREAGADTHTHTFCHWRMFAYLFTCLHTDTNVLCSSLISSDKEAREVLLRQINKGK